MCIFWDEPDEAFGSLVGPAAVALGEGVGAYGCGADFMVMGFFGVGNGDIAGAVVEGEGAGEGKGVADVDIGYAGGFDGKGLFEIEGFVTGN